MWAFLLVSDRGADLRWQGRALLSRRSEHAASDSPIEIHFGLFSAQFIRISTARKNEFAGRRTPMRATNETLIAAVRGGLIAGMDTSVPPSNTHGQFTLGRRA
jgi:hypothetical protein